MAPALDAASPLEAGPWRLDLLRRERPGPRIAEPAADPVSEADLSTIWEGQRYPPGALTANGEPVEVLYPGRRGGGAGPDFRDAVVRLAGQTKKGDVELHVRASYFLQHGHHLDAAYDGLVLHVVFLDDTAGFSPMPRGEHVPVAAFEPWVRARAADIASWLSAPPLWREPCQDAAARLGDESVTEVLRAAGAERFRARVSRLAEQVQAQGPNEALWQALLEALGYGADPDGFRRLGMSLPASLLKEIAAASPADPASAVFAALMAGAGLAAPGEGLPPALSPPMRRGSGRPANRPAARLSAAAGLFVLTGGDFSRQALESVREADLPGRDGLLARWHAPARPPLPGLGRGRLTELMANAVLPFAAALDPELGGRCLALAGRLAATPPYGKTLFLERNLARASGRRRAAHVLEQQGLLALHATWCSQGGCGRCPLS